MAVFDGVHYTLSPSLPPARRHDLASLLDLNGATSVPPHTHLVALAGSHFHQESEGSSLHDEEHGAKRDERGHGRTLKVVSDRWVDRSVVMGKLQPEQYYSPDPAMIFSGVVACATDIPASDVEVLSAGVTALGGQWRIGLTRDVTHLFALRPGSDKYNTALHFAPHTHMMIVTPHWFDDSVRLGRRLPETPYTWPDPLVLRPGATLNLEDDVNVNADGKRKRKRGEGGEGGEGDEVGEGGASFSIGNGGEKEMVWGGKRILLSRSLELGDGSREAVEAGIKRAGGVVVRVPEEFVGGEEEAEERVVDKCDVFVTRWRSGKAYFKAIRASLLIGTLTWLFSVESSGTLHSPLDSLLWYPVPRGGVVGLAGSEISLTNYTGAARDYLKRLISLMGAKFTPSMSASNKVLVAGFQPSPKTTRALSWSIPIVNHTWLEDCFVEWRTLTVGLERYIVFPPGIDFGKVLMSNPGSALIPPSTGSVPILSGGAVPGGRGVGVIDVELEESRDAAFSRDLGAGEEDTRAQAAVVQGQGEAKGSQEKRPGKSEVTKQHSDDLPSAKKTTPRRRSMSRTRSALRPVIDEVIEIPDDDDDADGEVQPVKRRGRLPKSSSARSPAVPSARRESRSKPLSLRTAPPGTSNSAREVEEAIILDIEEEQGQFTAGKDVDRMDVDEPIKSKSSQKNKSNVSSEAVKAKGNIKGKVKARQMPPSDDDTSGDDDVRVREDANSRSRPVKDKSTAKSSTKPSTKAKPETRESSPNPSPSPPPAITFPSPYRPKPRLVRRSLASSARKLTDVESELERPQDKDNGDEGEEEQPAKSSTRLSSTRKSAVTERKVVRAESDSDLPSPRLTTTSVKSGMKPKPKPTQKRTRVEEESEDESPVQLVKAKGSKKGKEKEKEDSEDEAYIRPVKVKESRKGKEKEEIKDKSKDKPAKTPVTKAKAKEKPTKTAAHSLSPTRSPSPVPPPPTGSLRTPKRTVSVLVPSLPKDYFTPGGTKVKDKEQGSPEKARPAEPAKTSSTHVAAVETSVSKKAKTSAAKPSPATTSRKLKTSSSLKPKHRPEDSEAEVEETTSMAVDSPVAASSARGGVRRSAAHKATTKLREEIMPDVIHFENEKKKEKRRRSVGGESLLSMRDEEDEIRESKRRKVEKENTKSKGKKTQRREEEDEVEEVGMQILPPSGRGGKSKTKVKAVAVTSDGSENEETGQRPTKGTTGGSQDKKVGPQKKTPSKNVCLMTTGVMLSDDVIKGLTKLGVKMTTKPTDCTHLVAKGIVRTEKFLCAMSVSPYILTEDWPRESASKGKILPEDDFLLSDPTAEKKWNFKFSEALERSKGAHAGSQLFKQMTFYVTRKVSVDNKLLKNIVTAAGGHVQMTNPTVRILKGKDNRYVVSCAEDVSIWRSLAQEGYKIYSAELILQAVLKQKIEWENEECVVA